MVVTSKHKECCVFAFSLCLSVCLSFFVCLCLSARISQLPLSSQLQLSPPDESMTPETILPMGSGVKGWSGVVSRAGLCPLPLVTWTEGSSLQDLERSSCDQLPTRAWGGGRNREADCRAEGTQNKPGEKRSALSAAEVPHLPKYGSKWMAHSGNKVL